MAGAGFKTFNTGDVLTASDVNTYLMQQTVMVFASSAARTSALGANVAEGMFSYLTDTNVTQYYDGSTWVTLSTGGDITAVNAGAGLSGGGTSGDVTLSLNALSAGRNAVINGGYDIWQRGTSIAVGASAKTYSADRWWGARGSSVAGETISRQATGDTTNLPFLQYCARVQRDSGNTSTQFLSINQDFESVNSIRYAGQTVSFSFYARKGANFSGASDVMSFSFITGTGTDQSISTGFTGQVTAFSGNATLTTTWQRFTFTGSLASTATQIALQIYYTPVGTAGAADYFEIAGVQVELGSSATPFSRAGGTIQGELAACQRYWQQSYNAGTAGGTASVGGFQMSPQQNSIANGENTGAVTFPTTMRTAPTVSIWSYAGTSGRVSTGNAGGDLGANSGTVQNPSVRHFALYNNSGGTITTNSLQTVFHWTASAEL